MATKKQAQVELTIPELIAYKRDGGELTEAQVASLVRGYTTGAVADYQMAAFAMATFFRGMTPKETAAITLAMRDSGHVLDLDSVPGTKVDKHSTGGVGDKVSICLAPIVAACGVPVPMISGRGLGHTGGTVDKLEAIPGFRMDGSPDDMVRQLKDVGCTLYKQTVDLAPADKKLYALRDVTGTIESIPLITASILSKKLAEGIDALVLDVKVGRGAFMKTQEQAQELARSIVRVGRVAKKKVTAILTRMDDPLGRTVGNAIETREAIEVLHGKGPEDLVECTMALGAEMLVLGGVERSERKARKRLELAIQSGAALAKMEQMVEAQGGEVRVVAEPDRLVVAKRRVKITAPRSGFVRAIDALEVGWTGVALGAGRTRSDQEIDHAIGITLERKPGDRVSEGDVLCTVHAHSAKDVKKSLRTRLQAAFQIGRSRPKRSPLVLEVIRR